MTSLETQSDLFERNVFAHVATILPDGSPHVVPVWVDYDGEHLIVSGQRSDRRTRNLEHNPAVAVSIMDPDNPYRSLLVHGRATEITTEGARSFVERMARKYWGVSEFPFDAEFVKITIEPADVVDSSSATPEDFDHGG
jgi:PPOX class probable F420-dependent enzyme